MNGKPKSQRIALLSDIHGNDIAFNAVVEHAMLQGADDFIIVGDLITDYPQSKSVLNRAKALTENVIAGNREKNIINIHVNEGARGLLNQHRQMAPLAWTYDYLGDNEFSYISSLPEELLISTLTGKRILCAHQSPMNRYKKLHPHFNNDDVVAEMELLDADILVLGHMHEGVAKWYGSKLFVNPGSVGVNYSGQYLADYAILTIDGDDMACTLFHIPYSGQDLLESIAEAGMLDNCDIAFWLNMILNTQLAGRDLLTDFFRIADELMIKAGSKEDLLPNDIWEDAILHFNKACDMVDYFIESI